MVHVWDCQSLKQKGTATHIDIGSAFWFLFSDKAYPCWVWWLRIEEAILGELSHTPGQSECCCEFHFSLAYKGRWYKIKIIKDLKRFNEITKT